MQGLIAGSYLLLFSLTPSPQSKAATLLSDAAKRMMNAQRPVYSVEYRYCLEKIMQRM